jgi:hypothetical protein
MIPEIVYWTNAAAEGMYTRLSISAKGESTLVVTSNRDDPAVASVGIFRTSFSERQLAPLLQALRAPAFAEVKNPGGMMSGQVLRKILVKEEGREAVARMVLEDGKPAGFVAPEGILLTALRMTREKAFRAVALEPLKFPTPFKREEPVSLAVSLAGLGPEEVFAPLPQKWEELGVDLSIRGVRGDVHPTQVSSRHLKFEAVKPAEVKVLTGAEEGTHLARIGAGRPYRLDVRRRYDWPPGAWRVEVSFTLPLFDREGAKIETFELVAPESAAHCTGAVKPEDLAPPPRAKGEESEPQEDFAEAEE